MKYRVPKISNVEKTPNEIYIQIRRDPRIREVLEQIGKIHPETARHVIHLIQMSVLVGQFLDIPDDANTRTCTVDELVMIGMLAAKHDDGKMDDDIVPTLIKTTRYGQADREVMSQHPERGFLKYAYGSDTEKLFAVGCLTHHTFRRDPYPTLTNDQLHFCEEQYYQYPLLRSFCALIGVVDPVEALVADPAREYLKDVAPYSWSEAIAMARVDLNTDDPDIARVIKIIETNADLIARLSSA